MSHLLATKQRSPGQAESCQCAAYVCAERCEAAEQLAWEPAAPHADAEAAICRLLEGALGVMKRCVDVHLQRPAE